MVGGDGRKIGVMKMCRTEKQKLFRIICISPSYVHCTYVLDSACLFISLYYLSLQQVQQIKSSVPTELLTLLIS